MLEALLVSNLVLWVAVVALAGVIFALVRQIGVLHERLVPAGALMAGPGPRVGEAAPVQRVADLAGAVHEIGAPSADGRSTLLFFLSPSCPVCKELLPALRALARSEADALRVVLASDGPREEHERFVREQRLEAFPYVVSAALGLAHRVAKLPTAVLIDERGVLRARGLVNTREHLESLFEAKERGVASIQEFFERSADRTGAA